MNRMTSKWMQMSLGFVAEGGSLAEEVISTIRTAQAFGSQRTLAGLYEAHISKAKVVDMKAAAVHGIGLGFFFFIIYNAYALGASFSVRGLLCTGPEQLQHFTSELL